MVEQGRINPFIENEKRIWHRNVVAIERPEKGNAPGAIVWLGDLNKKNEIADFSFWHTITKDQYNVYWKPEIPNIFSLKIVADRKDGKPSAHYVNFAWGRNDQNTEWDFVSLNPDSSCGKYWIGIAQYPLNPNWEDPSCSWAGWTHVFHTNDLNEADVVFKYTAEQIRINGYPENLKKLSLEVGGALNIDPKNPEYTWQLPWLRKDMKFHPVTEQRL